MASLLILGGGIVGAGVARDAAMRGLSVTLLEKDTVGHGTSSRSSRLIHGGIRYLELGDFHLVHEALRERATLLHIAPHLVRELPFLFLLDPGQYWQWFRTGIGVMAYRVLAGRHALGPHHPLTRAGVIARDPLLAQTPMVGGALYQDAHGDDLGLVRANIASAQAAGARVIEHCHPQIQITDNGVTATTPEGERIDADALVLALGPWTDVGRAQIGMPERSLVGGTKGIHITVPIDRLPLREALALRHPDDRRVMFCIPEPDRDRIVIGTTDTETAESPDALTVGGQDVAYLMRAAQHLFPTMKLSLSDINGSWAGLRPLLKQQGAESSRTREHLLLREGRVLTIAGGKLTTYRSMAEEAVDAVGEIVGHELPACVTASTSL